MFLEQILEAPPDPIFGLISAFAADTRPNKISLTAGIFKDEHLQSSLLPVVQKTKSAILPLDEMADYLPIDGLQEFNQQLGGLVFGQTLWEKHHGRIYGAQTVGGTSALRIGAEFLAQNVGKILYLPQPTWANHRNIFEHAGLVVETVPYYSHETHGFDAKNYLAAVEKLPFKSILLLHACCHNPTGSDPTFEDWKQISRLCKERKIFPFFDFAYQGLGKGIDEDAKIVRFFLEEGHEFFIAYSCSKNFSLYCQRVGVLFSICPDVSTKVRIGSQIKRLIRALYSNPPAHGAKIVAHILKNQDLRHTWEEELGVVRKRVIAMRQLLAQKLMHLSKKREFDFLLEHNGMFSYLDLTKEQVQALLEHYAVYTLESGRVNVAGITPKNIDAIVKSIVAVCEL